MTFFIFTLLSFNCRVKGTIAFSEKTHNLFFFFFLTSNLSKDNFLIKWCQRKVLPLSWFFIFRGCIHESSLYLGGWSEWICHRLWWFGWKVSDSRAQFLLCTDLISFLNSNCVLGHRYLEKKADQLCKYKPHVIWAPISVCRWEGID